MRHNNKISFFIILILCLLPFGCAQNAAWHSEQVANKDKQTLTVGTVQKHIYKGMAGGQVAEVLGSPNVVSTGENGNEVWIYDRFHTEQVASGSNGLTLSLSNIASGASRTSQSSITIIIKFDSNKKVYDYAYHKSKF